MTVIWMTSTGRVWPLMVDRVISAINLGNTHIEKKVKKDVYSSSWNLRATKRHLPMLPYGNHTVLPATRHRWARPTLTPAMQAGTRFTYPEGMEGWVDLVTRKRSRRESNSRPLGHDSNALATEPPSHQDTLHTHILDILTTISNLRSLLKLTQTTAVWFYRQQYDKMSS